MVGKRIGTLQSLNDWNARKVKIAKRYLQGLARFPLQLTVTLDLVAQVWYLFMVATSQRDALQILIHYLVPPLLQHDYADLDGACGSFPLAERYANEVLNLPMGLQLSMAAVDQVIDHVRAFYSHGAA